MSGSLKSYDRKYTLQYHLLEGNLLTVNDISLICGKTIKSHLVVNIVVPSNPKSLISVHGFLSYHLFG